jgi:hypothetical protein
MDEGRLSPDLGRLIDQAKGAAALLGLQDPLIETVALLTDGGDIYTGATLHYGEQLADPAAGSGASPRSAAHLALERAQEAGAGEVLAAAVGAPYNLADTVLPSVATYERLVGLDPELPLVIKQDGRWVMLPANKVSPAS